MTLQGWICSRCGASLSPFTSKCACRPIETQFATPTYTTPCGWFVPDSRDESTVPNCINCGKTRMDHPA